MKKVIVKFLDGGYCNLEADRLDCDDKYISVFNGDTLIGIYNIERLEAAYISETTEQHQNKR